MSSMKTDFIEVIERLPLGSQFRISGVDWEDYEELLADLGEKYNVRVSFNDGELEVMSPLPEHEEYKDIIHDLLRTLARQTGMKMETRGSATLKREMRAKGVEPDGCYWVRNARLIIGKRTIDLKIDPPPDIVVEIDLTHRSTEKFPIYAALGVPEIWRYDGSRAYFYRFENEEYEETDSSPSFTLLTSENLTQFIEEAKIEGQDAAIESLRSWLNLQKS